MNNLPIPHNNTLHFYNFNRKTSQTFHKRKETLSTSTYQLTSSDKIVAIIMQQPQVKNLMYKVG